MTERRGARPRFESHDCDTFRDALHQLSVDVDGPLAVMMICITRTIPRPPTQAAGNSRKGRFRAGERSLPQSVLAHKGS